MQLVETIASRNPAEHGIARKHGLAQQIDERRGDRDEDAVEDAEADRAQQRDHREGELHAADAPKLPQGGDIDQAYGRRHQDRAEHGDRDDLQGRREKTRVAIKVAAATMLDTCERPPTVRLTAVRSRRPRPEWRR